MPKYMILGKYSKEGIAAAAAEGFSTRADAMRPMVEGLGGSVDAMYFCSSMQGFDFVLLLTAPNADLLYAMAFAGASSSAFADGAKIVELKTGEEADAIIEATTEITSRYRPPGGN